MRKATALVLGLFFLNSCIPIRIAPNIPDYKLTKGKKFKRGLPKKTTFVFEDPKDAGEFYDYINTKFDLDDYFVDTEVPFMVDDNEYFFSFYEVEIPNKTLNLVPLAVDVALIQGAGFDEPVLEDLHSSRKGNWYIAIEVFTVSNRDCLNENTVSREQVLPYLRDLKEEYLSTHNYNEVLFKN